MPLRLAQKGRNYQKAMNDIGTDKTQHTEPTDAATSEKLLKLYRLEKHRFIALHGHEPYVRTITDKLAEALSELDAENRWTGNYVRSVMVGSLAASDRLSSAVERLHEKIFNPARKKKTPARAVVYAGTDEKKVQEELFRVRGEFWERKK